MLKAGKLQILGHTSYMDRERRLQFSQHFCFHPFGERRMVLILLAQLYSYSASVIGYGRFALWGNSIRTECESGPNTKLWLLDRTVLQDIRHMLG